MDNITPFPGPHLTPADYAERYRWSAVAPAIAGAGWWTDVVRTEAGDEYVCIGQGSPDAAADFIITPRRGRWDLADHRGDLVGSFQTLRAALEAICRTLPVAA